jgi:hypothetical protein
MRVTAVRMGVKKINLWIPRTLELLPGAHLRD